MPTVLDSVDSMRGRAIRILSVALFTILILPYFTFLSEVEGQVRVRGYFRRDGTYVQPHSRTAPDSNPYNNYSYPGNYNPNTGKITGGDPSKYLDRYYNRSRGQASRSTLPSRIEPLYSDTPKTTYLLEPQKSSPPKLDPLEYLFSTSAQSGPSKKLYPSLDAVLSDHR